MSRLFASGGRTIGASASTSVLPVNTQSGFPLSEDPLVFFVCFVQPTRLPRPWDSPGKNTGVGCHFLLQCMKVKNESEVAQSCPTLSNPVDCSLPGSSTHGILQARALEWGAIAFSKDPLLYRLEGLSPGRCHP